MSGAANPWAPRRFWTQATVVDAAGGFGVALDDRPLRTPGRAALVVPVRALAQAVADEWAAQDGTVRPDTMPVTRAVNAAIDRVAPDPEPLIDGIAAYGESDLLCHRAPGPAGLVARQAAAWDPLLAWAERDLGARLVPVQGVMPAAQPPESLSALRAAVARLDAFALTGLSEVVSLSGSVVIGLAVALEHRPAAELWDIAHLDEIWQTEQWGSDAAAEAARALRGAAFQRAADLLAMLR
ncbi:ATP12 family chaperone protein [Rhodobaculum claviforme]|uniref:ATPase n=1 Tax=Rhodobaculum claviforme TaxID=1549854 RepID=A0A934WKC6_9RHOB|nr:ATP12 family protein [Rhodobaculum claviforme]MBK5928724.1 ATPase [Rhodobaculum claviforme]